MCETLPASPAAWIAATESPPPTIEIAPLAVAAATARAISSVPFANAGISNTPIGPFHTIVFACASSALNFVTVSGPTSRPIHPSGVAFTLKLTGTVVASTPLELTLNVTSLASWPSHVKQTKLNRVVTLTATDPTVTVGQKVVVWTLPAPGTVATITGAPDALTVDRVL